MAIDWQALQFVLSIVTALVAAAAAAFAWRLRQRNTTAELEERLAVVEQRLDAGPSSDAVHELALSMERLGGEIKAVSERLEGIKGHTKRLDSVTARLEGFLLRNGVKE